MAQRKPEAEHEPVKCEKCGAWVFTTMNMHAYACPLYRSTPALVSSSFAYYEQRLRDLEEQKKREALLPKEPKRRRKKVEKDSGI